MFRPTSGFLRSEHSTQSCRCGSVSGPQTNGPRFDASGSPRASVPDSPLAMPHWFAGSPEFSTSGHRVRAGPIPRHSFAQRLVLRQKWRTQERRRTGGPVPAWTPGNKSAAESYSKKTSADRRTASNPPSGAARGTEGMRAPCLLQILVTELPPTAERAKVLRILE